MIRVIFAMAPWLCLKTGGQASAQPIKLTIGQTDINPGIGPLLIAHKETLFADKAHF